MVTAHPAEEGSLTAEPPTGPVTIGELTDPGGWDAFVERCPTATMAHLWQWGPLIRDVFGHESTYLAARRDNEIVGVLPLVRFTSWLFGRFVVSMPFLNSGGIAAVDQGASRALLQAAEGITKSHRGRHVELRHTFRQFPALAFRQHKVAMRLLLSDDAGTEWSRLDRKVRNQVRKAQKEGLTAEVGGAELIDNFYDVFARNMRDLGTPVYPRRLFEQVLARFPERTRMVAVRRGQTVIAGALAFGFRGTLEVPWASSLNEFRSLCPNMLLYWTAIEWACSTGQSVFDFGRSTPGEGTYHFKKQWGAVAEPLTWEYGASERNAIPMMGPDNPRLKVAIAVWKQLPLGLTTAFGPRIIRGIP